MAAEKRGSSSKGGQSAASATSSKFKPGGGGVTNKKYYHPSTESNNGNTDIHTNDNEVHLFPSSKLKLLHQRTSLSLAYDRTKGWGYEGETAMYLIANPNDGSGNAVNQKDGIGGGKDGKNSGAESSRYKNNILGGGDGKAIELALHLRDGCCVKSVEIYGAARTATVIAEDQKGSMAQKSKTKTMNQLEPLPHHFVSFAHHDPLSIVMTRPAKLHSVEDDGGAAEKQRQQSNKKDSATMKNPKNNNPPRRYDADAHAMRGTKGMTYSLRAASISSAVGELRIGIAPFKENGVRGRKKQHADGDAGIGSSSTEDGTAFTNDVQPPRSEADATQCWKDDLLSSFDHNYNRNHAATDAGETPRGTMECKMNADMLRHRCRSRREARFELIAKLLAESTAIGDGSANLNLSKKNGQEKKTKQSQQKQWPLSPAMKIVVRFALRTSPTTMALHLGGINLVAPTPPSQLNSPKQRQQQQRRRHPPSLATPHVYTTSGTFGDHQGIRSWLPTLDSASPRHRASHELVVKVTSLRKEGLWPCAAGEDFGANRSVCHPILGNEIEKERIFGPMKEERRKSSSKNDDGDGDSMSLYRRGVEEAERAWTAVEDGIAQSLGCRHARFIDDFFYGTSGDNDDCDDGDEAVADSPSEQRPINAEMLSRIRHDLRPAYVTSIFSSLVWSPCPSRSLGFAVGPFATLYDPEYFRLDKEDDDSDDEMENGGANDAEHSGMSLHEIAGRLGEGIRQLYFAPLRDRPWIHADASDEFIFGRPPLSNYTPSHLHGHCHHCTTQQRPEPSTAQQQDTRLLEQSILASTTGVPNRALSLMRDILALPAYRTSAYTQIWIPDARMSGSCNGGNMVGHPEVEGCNTFLGGAMLDGTLLPPPGMRLPFHDGGGGRTLQFLQARCAMRGWVRAALPLGSDDDVGQGYLHVLVEAFLMSLYERGHGAFGEGGGRGSFFYTKRYAIGSGLNSPNLDFLPLVNIEDDEVIGGGIGVAIEERGKEHLWRSANNGTETHTSSLDEYVISQLQAKDFIEAMERTDKYVPLPSIGWMGSHQSAGFLSHNSASSSSLGCGALDLVHPMGGQVYRAAKCVLLERVYEGRAGISHFTRVVRAAFMAAFLRDAGVEQLELPQEEEKSGGG
eukprot:CAMPEP_0196139554 /NCGR_PEP_ID=MMETSP0910-20130528/6791_1 /TAXON_ID=49265 /ORGANISM="Thalassiosira rotula, Strain GSO102" /LENGTH=1133 /DNA_ID=CAMNT_0041400295 /DNA_START=121 /DNA_END=3519 /DNA_ORIENTATION=+